LETIYCSNNKLNALDVTKNTALINLDCSHNLLTSLLTNSAALINLFCNYNQLTSLDVSNNTSMKWFFCDHNKIITLDVSAVKALVELVCSSNQLSSLDVSKVSLHYLYCDTNHLSSIDVSKDTSLSTLSCMQNQFTFSTLPLKQAKWTTYNYAPQKQVSIVSSLGTGIALDLSSQYLINGNTTAYTWKTKSGTTLPEGTDYTISNGKTVFLKAQADSVYCEMTNATFPDFAALDKLKTTNLKINTTTKTEENEIKGIDVYAHYKTIYISSPCDAQVSIFDINGRLIISKQIDSGMIDVQLQNTGIYLVKVSRSDASTTKKVFIE
jgi:hypothetical protein